MKEGWEYKKLGEVVYYPTERIPSTIIDGTNYVGVDNLIKERGGKEDATIFPSEGNCIKYKTGDVLIGNIRPYLKKIWLANNNGGASGDVLILRPNDCNIIYPDFLYWCLANDAFFEYDMLHSKGAKMPRGNKVDILKYLIPVPSISQQQHIVSELDLLSGVIEKQKAQLGELDKLAQSIFNDMFGDPVINENKWELKSMGLVFPVIKNGANIKQERGASGYPITRIETLSNGVFNRDKLGYADIFDIDKYSNCILNNQDILMSHINSKIHIGKAVLYRKNDNESIIHGMNLLRLIAAKEIIDPCYAVYFFKTEKFKSDISKIRKDAVNQSSFSVSDLKLIRIPAPPLSLQQEFASKIEAIESMKAKVRQSLSEAETLFNSRMNYYFN